jgi:large subunit ribosomal protein L35
MTAIECGGEARKEDRLRRMRKDLQAQKLLADIEDPRILKKALDGNGDMGRPTYRFLGYELWKSDGRWKLLKWIEKLNIVPDILPQITPSVEVRVGFGFHNHQVLPGVMVDSFWSELPAKLRIQVFDAGKRLVTIALIDADAHVVGDGPKQRCHFLAANVNISPTQSSIQLSRLAKAQVIFSWLPPYSEDAAIHRLSLIVLQQSELIDDKILRNSLQRDHFDLPKFNDTHSTWPVGIQVFRCTKDRNTAKVMARAGLGNGPVEPRCVTPAQKPRQMVPRSESELRELAAQGTSIAGRREQPLFS